MVEQRHLLLSGFGLDCLFVLQFVADLLATTAENRN